MSVGQPQSDTERAKIGEADYSFPSRVRVVLEWDAPDGVAVREFEVTADQFFGRGSWGAPMPAESLTMQIENLRKIGPPPIRIKGKRR